MKTYILYNEKSGEILDSYAVAKNSKELVKKYNLATRENTNVRAMERDFTCLLCDFVHTEGIHEH